MAKQPRIGQPEILELLEATASIYDQFAPTLFKRALQYPDISHNFITRNRPEQIDEFFERYPQLQQQYNIIAFNEPLSSIISFKEVPFCYVLNQNRDVTFSGSLQEQQEPLLTTLNQIGRRCTKFVPLPNVVRRPVTKQLVSNKNLGLIVSGIKRIDVPRRSQSVMQYELKAKSLKMKEAQADFESIMTSSGYQRDAGLVNIGFVDQKIDNRATRQKYVKQLIK